MSMINVGILAMCQGLTHSYGGLLAVRFLMGIVETALPAGSAFLLSTYYRKKEIALRMGCFYAFGQAGACFSGVCLLHVGWIVIYLLLTCYLCIAACLRYNGYGWDWRV